MKDGLCRQRLEQCVLDHEEIRERLKVLEDKQTVLVVKSSRADVSELTLPPCWQINEQEQVGKEEMIMHFLCS